MCASQTLTPEDEALLARLSHGVEIMLPPDGLREKLALARREKRPLIVKLGFDPSSPDLHIGHAVVLRKMRLFQEAGHRIVIIIGDFTARIGDPTGRNKARPALSEEQVEQNAKTYFEQLDKILDLSKIEVLRNSAWLKPMDFEAVLRLLGQATIAQILQRDGFSQRMAKAEPIGMHELVYPLMQGQDSIILNADIEMGGTDQLFNCAMGRTLQESQGLPAQIVLSMPLLVGTDGSEKMSKSQHNTIGLIDPPNEKFGKAMSIPDACLPSFLELATDFEPAKIEQFKAALLSGEAHPMRVKKEIAANIVKQYHGEQAAQEATAFFENQFQKKDVAEKAFAPRNAAALFKDEETLTLLDLCARLLPEESKTQIKRLILSGAVTLEGEKMEDPLLEIPFPQTAPLRLKIGKRGFYEVTAR